ncbi:Glycosyltransferase involved in cell wall bisynthesis [Tenacibaculum sp. MAR_2009_124]|uniref:glycosyl transferase family 1 n=1 Tax=Tenacibaculum sp. MAR_2009_124 TaxID=1250059 RepID=UPI000896A19A|nr:glycosyl transferase family 1 [Tenacibaculum sp. MAR_2009_124]SEC89939.1 Glycosyltransferase involved in cell wall bisynthesis [Tenacibaculum sp. MAR_2009_124]
MKVLIVTYYWPPAGGPGVQRWLKFVKYLRDYGVEPVVFTADNPSYPIIDESLKKDIPEGIEVIKYPILEPNGIISKFKKGNTQKSMGFLNPNPSFIEKLMLYIRANYFIPDARMFWIKPSVKKLKKYLEDNKIDALITTGPPYSVHLIGLHLKKAMGVKWIADFRDPWTSVDYFHLLPLKKKSIKKHYELEEKVLKTADSVLMVSNHAMKKYKDTARSIDVITNGFDEDGDFATQSIVLDSKFTLTHIGMMNSERNPKKLWEVLSEISEENVDFRKDFVLRFIGKIDKTVAEDLDRSSIKNIEKVSYVPHPRAKQYQRESQLLLIVVNDYPSSKEMIPGKTFEYLQARRPILGIAPTDGDLAGIIAETNSGKVFDYDLEKAKLKEHILNLYKIYKTSGINNLTDDVSRFHRKELTKKLVTFINQTSKN